MAHVNYLSGQIHDNYGIALPRQVFSSVGTSFIDDRVCLAMNNFALGKKGVIGREERVAVTVNLHAFCSDAQYPLRRERSFPSRYVKTRENTPYETDTWIQKLH